MKRILSILMILLIISMIIISPIAEDKPKAEGTDYGYLLSQFSPTFWVWFTQVISGMGLTASDLGTQLDYINRNGNIDQYFADLWEQFKTDAKSNWGYAQGYVKFTGQLWKDLFSGDPLRSIIGTKEMYEGSTDSQSPYYISNDIIFNGNPILKINQYDDLSNYFNNLSSAEKLEIINNFGVSSYDTTLYNYNVTQFYYNPYNYKGFIQKNKLTNDEYELYRYIYWVDHEQYFNGFIPALTYINVGGLPDNNGNTYKLQLLPLGKYVTWNTQVLTFQVDSPAETIIPSVSSSDIITNQADIIFDGDILDKTISNEDITENDYVLYELNRTYLEQIQELITKISMNEDTAEDWVLNPSQEVVRVETNNTVIREIIQAGDATIPVELDFPELQDFELPSALLTKFPFCIPWDVYNIFAMLNKPPVEPRFEIPFVIENIVDYDFVIEFDQFENLFVIARWFILALFCLGLIIMTRNMIKG